MNKKAHRNPVARWDADCDKVKRQRQAAYKRWEFTGNLPDLIEYKRIRALAKKTFKFKKKESFRKFAETVNFNVNLTYTWNVAKIFKKKWVRINANSRDKFSQKNKQIELALYKLCPEWVPSDPVFLPYTTTIDEPFSFTECNTAI